MNIKTKKLVLIIILAIPVIFLSGCEDVDLDLLEIFFEAWGEENDVLVNGELKPERVLIKSLEDTIAEFTNEEDSVEMGGMEAVRDKEKTDALIDQAWEEDDQGKMMDAMDLRPGDWQIREQEGIFALAGDKPLKGFGLDDSDQIIANQVAAGGDCLDLRIQQLEYRESIIKEKMDTFGDTKSEMEALQAEINAELDVLYDTHNSPFCKRLTE